MLAFDGSDPSSIVASIMSARENARQVREQISSEMWEQVNRLFHEVRRADLKAMAIRPARFPGRPFGKECTCSKA